MNGLPFSQEAEEAVIGSVLIRPSIYPAIAATLESRDFFFERNQKIWVAIGRLHDARDAIDSLTIAERLRNNGDGGLVEGGYLTRLIANTPTSVHAPIYGELVRRTGVRRRLMQVSDQIRKVAQNEELALDDVMTQSSSAFNTVLNDAARGDENRFEDQVKAVFNEIVDLWEQPNEAVGVPTGLSDMDALIGGFQRGKYYLVAGRPAMGKSSLLKTHIMHAIDKGYRIALWSGEMLSGEIILRMLSSKLGTATQNIQKRRLSPKQQKDFGTYAQRLMRAPLTIWDDPGIRPAKLKMKCMHKQSTEGLDIVFIDYVGLMTPDDEMRSPVANMTQISKTIKELAQGLQVPVVAAAQLSRGPENRQDKRPYLSDLRDSGSLEQDADVVTFVYRDAVYNEHTEHPNGAELIVAKHRNGPTGTVQSYFDGPTTRFTDATTRTVNLGDAS